MNLHNPIVINSLDLILPHKICFQIFSTIISYSNRIGILGKNGSGKSTLLKIIVNSITNHNKVIKIPNNLILGYVPQIIDDFNNLSGSQRFNKILTQELQKNPNLLVLDEPTNHLDKQNRNSLMKMLNNYLGTLIVVSHNEELLNNCNILWHIDNEKITIFNGKYNDYLKEVDNNFNQLQKNLNKLKLQKKEATEDLIKNQQKISKKKQQGQKNINNKKWTKLVAGLKTSGAEKSNGKKLRKIEENKNNILKELHSFSIPEQIIPKFSLTSREISDSIILQIKNGKISYRNGFELSNINLSLQGNSRLSLIGKNASGKSTLLRSILNLQKEVIKEGDWFIPKLEDIGYLDQHYNNLNFKKTVIENLSDLSPKLSHLELRNYLNNFLFRKNEEVNSLVSTLSEGEKARLTLAQIGLKTPKLLILDEITNNLDIDTTKHIINVLEKYKGAIIITSHDDYFLQEINITDSYDISKL